MVFDNRKLQCNFTALMLTDRAKFAACALSTETDFNCSLLVFFPCPVQLRAFPENQQYSGIAVICSCWICLIATENVYLIGQKSLHSETSTSIRSLVFPKFGLVSLILFGPLDRLYNFTLFFFL